MREKMPAGSLTSVGIGDDAAVVTTPSGSVVAAVDMVIEGRHFHRYWSSGYDVGVKAAARSLADIAAMGAVNTALLVALAAPGTLQVSWATDLAAGLAAEAERAGAGIVGGDTSRADVVMLSVTALGDLDGLRPVLRSGARPGDVVAMTGVLGRSAAGLALLTAGSTEPSVLVSAHLRPRPPYDSGPEAARLGATAMIDVSDGLIADLGHVADESGVRVNLDATAFTVDDVLRDAALSVSRGPASGDTGEYARALAMNWVLTGGEDHALVATFPPGTALPDWWQVIGEVREGSGVTVDNAPHQGPGGWQHFR